MQREIVPSLESVAPASALVPGVLTAGVVASDTNGDGLDSASRNRASTADSTDKTISESLSSTADYVPQSQPRGSTSSQPNDTVPVSTAPQDPLILL